MNERCINIKLIMYKLVNYIIKTIPKYLKDNLVIKLKNNTLEMIVSSNNLFSLITFLKNHSLLQYKTITAITAVDYLKKEKRFQLIYFLLSYKLNSRLIIKLNISDREFVDSITPIFKGANWYEREVWDLFGIFFKNHPDLRRILTDYGFEGFALRKDFPQSGFSEVRYDDANKHVMYERLELAQEYRSFLYLNPWFK
jgi:NADH dehydrogenase (ubiquinone) Fe-S protein 3